MNKLDYDFLEKIDNLRYFLNIQQHNEKDNQIGYLLIYYARAFYDNHLYDLAIKWLIIAQNYCKNKNINPKKD
jgi:hypothetical protein